MPPQQKLAPKRPFQVASAQRARAHGEAMMKRCREAAAGWMSRTKWRTFSLEKGPFLRGNESSNHQFSGDIIYLVGFQGGVIHHDHFFLDASRFLW